MFHLVNRLLAVMVIQASYIQSEARPIRFSLPSFFAWKPTFPPNPFVPQTSGEDQVSTDALVNGLNQFKQRVTSRLAGLESLYKELSGIPDQIDVAAADSKKILDAAIDAFVRSTADMSQKCVDAIHPSVVGLKNSLKVNVCKREAAYEKIRRDLREHVTRMKGLSTKTDGLVTTLGDCGRTCGKATLAEVEQFLKHADVDLPDVEARKLLVDALVPSQECVARKAASVRAQLDAYKSTFDVCVTVTAKLNVRTLINQLDEAKADVDRDLHTVQEYTTILDNVSNQFSTWVEAANKGIGSESMSFLSVFTATPLSTFLPCQNIHKYNVQHLKINEDECSKTSLISEIHDQLKTIEHLLKEDSGDAQDMSNKLQSCGSECKPSLIFGVGAILRSVKTHLSDLGSLKPWVTFIGTSKECINYQKRKLSQQFQQYRDTFNLCTTP